MRISSRLCVVALLAFVTSSANSEPRRDSLKNYMGVPYQDSLYHGGAQKIPGKVPGAPSFAFFAKDGRDASCSASLFLDSITNAVVYL